MVSYNMCFIFHGCLFMLALKERRDERKLESLNIVKVRDQVPVVFVSLLIKPRKWSMRSLCYMGTNNAKELSFDNQIIRSFITVFAMSHERACI